MEIVCIALRPVRPTRSFASTAVAGARELHAQPKMAFPVVEQLWEVGTARMKIKTTFTAVKHEPLHVFPAGVAVPPDYARRSAEELKDTFVVEFVCEA